MRILIANDNPCAHKYIRMAFARALSVSEHEVVFWEITQKNAYDAFDELEPDIFFGQAYNLNRSTIECIKERPEMKLVLRVSDRSDFNDKIDKEKYPVLSASDEEIEIMEELKSLPNKMLCHTHHHPDYLQMTHGRWIDEGFDLYAFENFADVFDYSGGKFRKQYECDLAFIGGYWGYKAQNIDKYIMPLCSPVVDYNIHIFGNQAWPTSKYCGFLPDAECKDVLKSAKVCLAVHEPHSTEFHYDVVTREYNLMINKCFFISDWVEGLETNFPAIQFGSTPEEYQSKIDHFLNRKAERNEIVDELYNQVLAKHTAFDRLEQIFERLDLETDSIIKGKQLVVEKKEL